MPRRPLARFALAGAIFVSVPAVALGQSGQLSYAPVPKPRPAAAIGSDVGSETTGPVPPHPGADVHQNATRAWNIAMLKSGMDALKAKDTAFARAVRDSLSKGSLDRDILAWAIALQGDADVPGGEIAATAQMLPGWPGMDALRRSSEMALLRASPSPRTVVQAFGTTRPQTAEGTIILARALVVLGDRSKARAVLSPLWRREKLGTAV